MTAPTDPIRPPLTRLDDHPLEVFAWARRFRPSPLRDLVFTLIFNQLLVGVFTLFGMLFTPPERWRDIVWANVVFSNCIGFTIHAEFALGGWLTGNRCGRWPFWGRAFYYSAIPVIGVVVGYWIGFEILDWKVARANMFTPGGIAAVVALSLILSSVLGLILSARERAAKSQAAFEAERARVATAERTAALAQLQALEAQVEPHFLYNTLAHVVSMIETEPATARRMLERLIVLLRASATSGADGRSTLGEQLAQMRAYLDVLGMRMGPRLAWSIESSDALAGRELPPAMLQPLVENAIKHGIEPALAGGAIAIAARDEGGRLVVEVADTGVGFVASSAPIGGSTGLGLSNLRARLAALYGDDARVTIAENRPSGVRVTISLPARGFR
ncbi:MAG: histidine kinase [Betaproteobacteria bacterium]